MDLSELRSVRIASWTRIGIIDDIFGENIDELPRGDEEELEEVDYEVFPYHARAFCLYAALLVTNLYETAVDKFEPYLYERKKDAMTSLPQNPKYAAYSEKELDKLIDEITKKDIRNCFAHGSFGIGFVKKTDRLYFVLNTEKSEIQSEHPIIISASTVYRVIRTYLKERSLTELAFLRERPGIGKHHARMDSLPEIVMPANLMGLVDHYMGDEQPIVDSLKEDERLYELLQYITLATKVTYEQTEYYNLFGTDTSMFKALSLVRNSISHKKTKYSFDNGLNLTHQDKKGTTTGCVLEVATRLGMIDNFKRLAKLIADYNHEKIDEVKDHVIEECEKIYKSLFESGMSFEDAQKEIEEAYKVSMEGPEDTDNTNNPDDPDDQPK